MIWTNERAILLQKRILDLTRKINKESNDKRINTLQEHLESTIEEFDFELSTLPQQAKQLDKNGYIIPWRGTTSDIPLTVNKRR